MRGVLVIYRRELKAYFNTPIAYIFLPILIGILSFLLFKFLPFFALERAEMRSFFGLMPYALFIFAPAVTMRLWSEELRIGTAEILLTLPFKVWQVVLGKFLAAYSVLLLALFFTLGIPLGIAYLGDPDWGPIIGGYVGSTLLGALFVALGALVSSFTQNQVVALLLGVFAGVVLTLGFGPQTAAYLADKGTALTNLVQGIGVISHFESIERGILALSDVSYFLTVSCFFLVLNVFCVESRRY